MKKAFWALAGLCLVAGAILLYRSLRPAPPFYRVPMSALPQDMARFHIDPVRGRIHHWVDGRSERLPDLPNCRGGLFSLNGVQRIRFTPPYDPACGVYSFVYFRSRGKGQRIAFTVYRRRGKERQDIQRMRKAQAAFPLVVEPSWRRGDELLFEFSGQGIVYFSRPIFYRPTALPQREYVFLVAPDTFRGDLIGARRGGIRLTPHIDRFARDCVSFPNAFSSSSWTVPSFISLFTGRYPYHHGVRMGVPLDLSVPTLTSRLAERFITFGFHGGMALKGLWGHSRNFDHYEGLPQAGPLYPKGGRSLFEKALALVHRAAFPRAFLFLHTYQVHEPYTPPEEFLRKRDPSLPYRRLSSFNSGKPERSFMPVSDELRRASQELYEAEAMAFDDYFGAFIGELRRLGIYDRSLIVLTSDHGEEFFEHGGWGHCHTVYRELLSVPLLIKFPGQKHAGRRPGCLAGVIDILPTLLDYYSLPPPSSPVDGLSLLPALAGKDPRRYLVADIATSRYDYHFPPKFALFSARTKVIYNYPPTPGGEFYFAAFGAPPARPSLEWFDLGRDPGEFHRISQAQSVESRWLGAELLRVKSGIERAMIGSGYSSAAQDDEARRILQSLGYL
jgi:arylsulfatase A-like enzyme